MTIKTTTTEYCGYSLLQPCGSVESRVHQELMRNALPCPDFAMRATVLALGGSDGFALLELEGSQQRGQPLRWFTLASGYGRRLPCQVGVLWGHLVLLQTQPRSKRKKQCCWMQIFSAQGRSTISIQFGFLPTAKRWGCPSAPLAASTGWTETLLESCPAEIRNRPLESIAKPRGDCSVGA